MSYCVNCGVELDDSAKKCALCSTPVINPNKIVEGDTETPFSEELLIPESVKKRFIALVITVVLLIPVIVMFFLNVFFIKNGFWSVYAFFSCALLWVLAVLPLLFKKVNPYAVWGIDTVAILSYSFAMIKLLSNNKAVLYSVLSVLLISSVFVLLTIIFLNTKKRHWTAIVVVELCETVIASFLSGIAVSVFVKSFTSFVVGTVISLCALVLMLFFIYCNRSKSVRAWLNKVLYI